MTGVQTCALPILFLGTAVYNGSVYTCDNGYETIKIAGVAVDNEDSGKGIIRTPASMASPSLTRSPMIYAQQRKAEQARLQQSDSKVKNGTNRSYHTDA